VAPQQNAEEIFNRALELKDPAQRAAYLDEACAGEEKLRAQVNALLRWDREAGAFMDVPDRDPDATLELAPVPDKAGALIGRYKLLEKIGEGGMAVVYMAEQKQPIRRRVAVKLIKLGMDSKQVIGRFEAERQALAMMDHPNIAKVLDAGTTETRRPYFVMELVRGLPITEFCDRNNLSTQERLELFVSVCQAVHHAHQKGVIHRDIKPSNVLVTLHDGEPVAKVIDFGIAKAINQQLTEKTVFTRYSQMIGTPQYMSPEQAEMSGLDIDTRSDVFSLGVLLYELLTGTTPLNSEYLLDKGYAELQRIIREEEPVRPSTKISTLGEALVDVAKRRRTSPELLCKLMRTDLDWVVMKTLEKDRNRRYESVSEMAADIRRHLNNEPVQAGRPSVVYQFRKFVQRHHTLVAAVTAVTAAVVLGLVISTTLYIKVRQSNKRETTARAEAEAVIEFLTDDLLASVFPDRAKSQQVTVRYIIGAASERLQDRFEDKPRVEAEIRETLGLTYYRLGDFGAAEPHLQRVWEIRRSQLGEEAPATLAVLADLGMVYMLSGRYEEGEPLLLKAVEAQTRVLGREHEETLQSMVDLAQLYTNWGRIEKTAPLAAEVLEVARRVLGEEHPVTLSAMRCSAWQYMAGNQLEKAESLAKKGHEISRRVLGDEHEDTLFFRVLLAWSLEMQGRAPEGITIAEQAMELGQQVLGEEHWMTLVAMNQLGSLYRTQGRYKEAEPLLAESVRLNRRVMGDGHITTVYCMWRLAWFYEEQKRYDDLDATIIEIQTILRTKLDPDNILAGRIRWTVLKRIDSLGRLARENYDVGRYEDARDSLAKQQDLRQALDPGRAESSPADMAVLAMSLHRLGREREAATALQRLRETFEKDEHHPEEQSLYEAEKCFTNQGSRTYELWDLIEEGMIEKASEMLDTVVISGQEDEIPDSAGVESLRNTLSRAYCLCGTNAEAQDEYREAVSAYETALHGNPDFARAHDQLARLLASCPDDEVHDTTRAIDYATKACELTQWQDASYLTTLATAHAEAGDFHSAVSRQKQAISLYGRKDDESLPPDYLARLRLYESSKPYHPSMVARWDFEQSDDGVIRDSTGHGLDGKLVGDAKILHDLDRNSKVLHLDGDGDWVDCGKDPQFDIASELTVTCWAKVTKFDKQFQTIISKGDDTWRISRNRGDANGPLFGCNGPTFPNTRFGAIYGRTNINDGRWHLLVGVYNGSRVGLYVDGKLDVSSEASGQINTNTWSVLIGNNEHARVRQADDRSFNGLIDDVRVYNYALTEAEIKALHAATSSEPRTERDSVLK